ncbi:MAG: maleylpyruvate isomerase family mycothiol-dependent enzyme [Acidimicrobiales bacterium]
MTSRGDDTIHEACRQVRLRLTAWASGLSEAEASTAVPALPGWTVRDTIAHLAGLAAEVNAGALSGVPDDDATARQVEARADHSLSAILDEWDAEGPVLEENLAAMGRSAPIQVVIDVWSHEIDVRSALGVAVPDGAMAERLMRRAVRVGLGRSWAADGVPPLCVVTEDDRWVIGGEDPVGTLTTTWFELGRVMLGRRSPAQMRALAFEGADPEPWVAAIPAFGPAEVDVVDSPPRLTGGGAVTPRPRAPRPRSLRPAAARRWRPRSVRAPVTPAR